MIIMTEMTTEEVESFVNNSPGKILVKLPLFSGNDVAIDRAVGFVGALEEEKIDVGVIVFSRNSLSHEKIVPTEKRNTVAKMTQWIVDGLHIDYLPYTDLIISIEDTKNNMDTLHKLCMRFGILDPLEIMVK